MIVWCRRQDSGAVGGLGKGRIEREGGSEGGEMDAINRGRIKGGLHVNKLRWKCPT